MWRSSRSDLQPRLHNEPRRRCPARGFTLLEAMVSLLLLVVVLIVAMTMLFQMRAFAERQQYFMLPRQAARRAADYLSYYFAGASDVNYIDSAHPSPNALIMYYNSGTPGVRRQASYNNLTGAEPLNLLLPPSGLRPANTSTRFGDIGTDIITMVAPFDPGRYQAFAPFPAFGAAVDLWFNFRVGCAVNDAANLAAFRAATGDDGTTGSVLLMLVDKGGAWSYVRIPSAGYQGDGLCSDVTNFKNIHVGPVVTASAALPAPPNGVAGLTDPVYLVTGLQVISFRVLTDDVDGLPKLQQKLGLFDPNTDNPGVAFTNVMENVEDLQVAYVYSRNEAAGPNGLVWNAAAQTINSDAVLCPGCTTHVPFQAGPSGAPPPLDISNVIGVRFSVTGRSPLLPLAAQQMTTTSQHFRPASEDHAVAPLSDLFDHYRATATLMLRSRIPRG
ncbi:MAG TPA: prepilin-type N-terminal cleavage/methylation domain-containing protein [Candidatus Deferrimicrobium sp.]|nr:prepilin-type N-terminal cleavage/methylation domain-containing protein [Candidatus Deferrimicrobium sp.]